MLLFANTATVRIVDYNCYIQVALTSYIIFLCYT